MLRCNYSEELRQESAWKHKYEPCLRRAAELRHASKLQSGLQPFGLQRQRVAGYPLPDIYDPAFQTG